MKKVLYVPNIGVNLVSVAAIGRGTDLRVNFVGPLVQIAHNNVVVVTGQQGPKPNSLYKLNIVAQVEEEAACIAKQYAAHPDIAFAVTQISRHCQKPGPQHWAAAKHVLANVKGTAQYGLCFLGSSGSSGSSHFGLIGWIESDFAGDLDFFRPTSDHIIREYVEGGGVQMLRVHTKDQLADAFTKPLPSTDFTKSRDLIGVLSLVKF